MNRSNEGPGRRGATTVSRKLSIGNAADRGVFIANFLGDGGEMILVSVRRDRRRLEERPIPAGSNSHEIANQMWDRLEREDPLPRLKVI